MGGHTHAVEHVTRFPSGAAIESCQCGATRELGPRGDVLGGHLTGADGWHTCSRCTQGYGLSTETRVREPKAVAAVASVLRYWAGGEA